MLFRSRLLYLGDNQRPIDKNRIFGLHVNFAPMTHEFLNLKKIIKEVYDQHRDNIMDIVPSCPCVGYYRGSTLGKLLSKR